MRAKKKSPTTMECTGLKGRKRCCVYEKPRRPGDKPVRCWTPKR